MFGRKITMDIKVFMLQYGVRVALTFALVASGAILIPSVCLGANSYTVCASGCTATTFAGFFSSHNLGSDDILEARADSPGGSKTFSETITPSTNSAGTLGHPAIIRARTGDTITIQGPGDTGYASNCIRMASTTSGYITFDGFNLTNYGYAAAYFRGVSATSKLPGITLQNCTATTSVIATVTNTTECFFAWQTDGLTFRGNTCHIADQINHNQTDCFYLQEDSNIDINGNVCWDQNQNGDGHNDGVQCSGGNGTSIAYGSTYNLTVRNNSFSHNTISTGAQQLMYFEYEIGGNNYIYNNLVYVTTGSASNMVSVYNKGYGTQGNFYFYNNTFRAKGSEIAFAADASSPNITFKNNIVYGESILMDVINTSNSPANFGNNLYYNPAGSTSRLIWGTTYTNFAGWQGYGFDNNYGKWGDPLFTATTSYPYSLQLMAGSPAIDAGADLSATFTTDHAGTSRPRGGVWDMGAYESNGLITLIRPSAPTGLR